MNNKMEKMINDRIKINIFIDKEFDYFPNDSYILVDCAHIYNYINKIGHVTRNNHYGEKLPKQELNISTIYLGYFGNGLTYYDHFTNYYIINTQFFKILDNQVKTYIDRLIELQYNDNTEIFDPTDIVKEIFCKIRRKYMDSWRLQYGKVDDSFDDNFNKYGQLITNNIIDIIMDESKNYTKNELIEFIYNYIIIL
jgi:hypothetical protein